MSITVQNVSKHYGRFAALNDVSLKAPSGGLLALLGPSGSGKTTLLRIIAGLEPPDAGTVHYHDDDITHRSARERNVGFVFQHYALFRHMTVFENVAFGLRVKPRNRRPPEAEIHKRVHELLNLARALPLLPSALADVIALLDGKEIYRTENFGEPPPKS